MEDRTGHGQQRLPIVLEQAASPNKRLQLTRHGVRYEERRSGAQLKRRTVDDPDMTRVHGFAPPAAPDAEVLVLGTMPGKPSLVAGRYYAHPRNAFRRIAGELLGFDFRAPYPERVRSLSRHRIAVWDVLRLCTRESSLDSDIEPSTIVPNDFGSFLVQHSRIARVCFNGAVAAGLFRRHVLMGLPPDARGFEYRPLPSTSPANAGVSFESKLAAWRAGLLPAAEEGGTLLAQRRAAGDGEPGMIAAARCSAALHP